MLLSDYFEHFPDVAEIDHTSAPARRDIGGKHLDGRVARAQYFGKLSENFRRQRTLDHHVKAVITMALAGPVLMPVFNRLLYGFAVCPAHKVDHCRGAA